MNRRSFVSRAVTAPFAVRSITLGGDYSAFAESAPDNVVTPAAVAGPDMSRYRLTLERVLHGTGPAYTPEFLLEDIRATPGRRFTNFSGDLSGRWIGALSTSAATFGESFPVLHEVVDRTIALQHPDGYFGGTFHYEAPDDDDLALLWGNGRLLVGLMEYYGLTQEPAVLASARKLGDFLIRIAPRFNSPQMVAVFSADHFASSYICWTQQTEGLAALYTVTRNERYRDLCAEISSRIQRRPGDHVHGYLSSLRGTLALYEATGDRKYLNQVVAAWQDVVHSGDMILTGGVPEGWSPKRARTEGCAECDWLRLNLSLYRATGELIYLDTALGTYFNEFSMNQFATGDYGHAKLDAAGIPITVYVRAWWCCTLHGLRTFADLQKAAFRVGANEVAFEFPIDSRIDHEAFSATATSRLHIDGTCRIQVHNARANQALSFYKPGWADDVTLLHNGQTVNDLRIERVSPGDQVIVQYGMSLRAEQYAEAPGQITRHKLYFGPWLLGAASSTNPEYFNELFPDNRMRFGTARRSARLPVSDFQVPIALTNAQYIPAEFPDQPAEIELRAIAEQTANSPADWQLLFRIDRNSGN